MIIFLLMTLFINSKFDSFLENDLLWLNASLNWEELFISYIDNLNIYSFIIINFFVNNFIFLDSVTKFSFLDVLFLSENSIYFKKKELYVLFLWDLYFFIDNYWFFNNFFFYSNYQDFTSLIMYYSPEVIIIFLEYITKYVYFSSFSFEKFIIYDLFSDKLIIHSSQLIQQFLMFFIWTWLLVFSLYFFRIFNFYKTNFFYFNLFFLNNFSLSKENRFQLDSFILITFFFLFYWTNLILTLDTFKEEFIEILDTFIFYLFNFLIAILIVKYSTHYFSFLESSIQEGRNVSFLLKQFFRDFLNTFSLFLRFFVLLFRLNVYDTLDDFYDSYYIFLCDFDDDSYQSEAFFSSFSNLFFIISNFEDSNYLLEDESDSYLDLFWLYFLTWSKLFLFIFFITEEIFRLILAFFICYLIIFDIHAVNSSYKEDNFLSIKKLNTVSTKYINQL